METRTMMAMRASILLSLVLGVASCGSDEPSTDPIYAVVVSGDGHSDTAGARVPVPLVATVSLNGRHASGAWVRFRPIECLDTYCAHLAPINSEYYSFEEIVGITDAQGRFAVKVQIGYDQGIERVVAEVIDVAASDTASYEALAAP